MTKMCKQCGRSLSEEHFRRTKSRSKGIYQTKQGLKTLCRECESANNRAHAALKKLEEGVFVDTTPLKQHYQRLTDAGHPPITAAARRLMGLTPVGTVKETNWVVANSDLLEHLAKVRNRSYTSFDEADAVHRSLEARLKEAGMYEETNNLMDEWYMDE